MRETERLEAKGPRGEACIIVRTWRPHTRGLLLGSPADSGLPSYQLATGERLRVTEDPAAFETMDGSRRFTLREA